MNVPLQLRATQSSNLSQNPPLVIIADALYLFKAPILIKELPELSRRSIVLVKEDQPHQREGLCVLRTHDKLKSYLLSDDCRLDFEEGIFLIETVHQVNWHAVWVVWNQETVAR